ncbi:MAG: hypothetical protein M1816_000423 [Peltula sp. TS41687]|nr:MAG: hypothetical protein M1816_000423 [Peltula sp. TS41687]
MARSDEAENFFAAVYQAVQEIPHGKVTSYGHIARLLGRRVCLKYLPDDGSRTFNSGTVPWQRVISSKGVISPRAHPSGASNQADALRQEGVEVSQGNMGELMVDLGAYGWFPDCLPSEEGMMDGKLE